MSGWPGADQIAADLEADLAGVVVRAHQLDRVAVAGAEKVGGRGQIAQGGGQRDAGHLPTESQLDPVQQGLQLSSARCADEGVQLVDDDVAQVTEHPPDPVAVPDEHRLDRLRGDQQHPRRGPQHQRLAAPRHVAVPAVHRKVEPLAEHGQPVVLVVDERLQRADDDRLDPRSVPAQLDPANQRGADRQPGGLGLAARRRRSEDDVAVAGQDRSRGPFLDLPQPFPTGVVDPPLDAGMEQLVGGGRWRGRGTVRAGRCATRHRGSSRPAGPGVLERARRPRGRPGEVHLVEQRLPARPGVLVEQRQQVEKALHGLPGSAEVGVADPGRAVPHVAGQRLVGNQVGGRVAAGMDVPQLRQQHVRVLRRQVGQPQHRSGGVGEPGSGEGVLRQPRGQRRVGEQAAAGVQQEVRGAAEEETQVGALPCRLSLRIAGSARSWRSCLGAGELVQVDHLVQADQQAVVAGQPDEPGHQLELVVDPASSMMVRTPSARRASARVLNSPRSQRTASALSCSLPVSWPRQYAAMHLGEVVAAGRLGQLAPAGRGSPLSGSVPVSRASVSALADERSTTPASAPPSGRARVAMLRISSAIQAAGLPAGGVQPPVRGEVGMHGDEPPLAARWTGPGAGRRSCRSRTRRSRTDRRPAVRDPGDVADHRPDLATRPTWRWCCPTRGTTPARSEATIASRSRGRIRTACTGSPAINPASPAPRRRRSRAGRPPRSRAGR